MPRTQLRQLGEMSGGEGPGGAPNSAAISHASEVVRASIDRSRAPNDAARLGANVTVTDSSGAQSSDNATVILQWGHPRYVLYTDAQIDPARISRACGCE